MIYTLQSEILTVEIEDLGAQLASIRTKDGTEYLYQGNPEVWARRAPILFPIIGRLQNNTYLLNGVSYTISNHGFARDMVFSVVSHSVHSVTFQLKDTPETKKVYPFSFVLTVTYTLEENRLTKSHTIENCSDDTMYYELGAHDGFQAPLSSNESMGDYSILLPNVTAIQPYGMNEHCMLTPKLPPIPTPDSRIALTPATYHLDTVVLDRTDPATVILCDSHQNPRVTVEYQDFPYLGIWTQAKPFDTNYVCLEPWSSLPDAVFAGRELSEKVGICALQPSQRETLTYTVSFS